MLKITTVVGARPQFIKAGALSRVVRDRDDVHERLIHTGQHYDANMSDVFFRDFELPEPSLNLEIGSLPHGAQTGRMLESLEAVLSSDTPDWLLVYGDTNSTLAGALAAAKLHIRVAHVEAGLRSFNRRMPEEINRVLTDHSADLLFAPTETAVHNLANEGIRYPKVRLVGDVMLDAVKYYSTMAVKSSSIMDRHNLGAKSFILATVHRAENTDDKQRLATIVQALTEASEALPVVFPLHPRTRQKLDQWHLANSIGPNVNLIGPVGYLDMLVLEQSAALIATDSGGVQKEAYFLGTPCVTLRDETEWVETLAAGWNRLAPPDNVRSVTSQLERALNDPQGDKVGVFGDGHAAHKIVDALLEE